MLNAVWIEDPDPATVERIRALLLAARDVDGRPELPEGTALPPELTGGAHLLADVAGELVGYAHLDTGGDSFGRQVAELIVRPDRRRNGYATAMVDALVDKAGAERDRLRVWSHGDHPGAARLAERAGFTRARELLVMHAEVADAQWPEPALREGVSIRTFRPGQDEDAVIAVNARAFDWHPEQGSLTADELRATEREGWFDPAGFFLAENATGGVVGFHWTKVHEPNPERFGGKPVGEVYVVGVDPAAQGGGLGKALTLAGLRHLADRGLEQIILYVEGDNAPAVSVYTGLGFTRYEVDVQYAR
ncbi:mycothiol synthase [Amycolatopsis marina]|uniref:Mycothiol acetyltransferase n=1 Tax=Amycolatopsis marina TaxID=490629 RepID=A0A1I0VGU0_9PSEU|nr:mycothiol synthase [Amycolatopsis marina]SFA74796.1 mycothiol synthase [Amycolatopsis marina]